MNTTFFIVLSILFVFCFECFGKEKWMNIKDTPAQRAQALLKEMNQTEKLAMVHGYKGPYVGNVNAVERLKIPAIHLEDGPQGVADGVEKVTAWPASLTVAASWSTEAMKTWGAAMGSEQRLKGTNVMLGPMHNIARVPMGGRNFEGFGESPFLAAALAPPVVAGIQSQGVIACSKHYIDNNQEYHRTSVSANVDERTQYEVYYPAFAASVKAGVGSIMCSYNKINDTYACENRVTLTQDLKQTLGFQGWVMSDWGATHSTVESANAGLDMEMPGENYFGDALAKAISGGQVPQSRLDDMVVRILTSMFAAGLFDNAQTGDLNANATSTGHDVLARRLAEEGTVLLKNENGLLPLSPDANLKIAVIGDDGKDSPTYAGGGSGHVRAEYVVTPFQGITNRVGSKGTVSYANSSSTSEAANLAKSADVAIVFVAVDSSEGSDRPNLSLPGNQDALVSAVVQAQAKTIVVVHSPGAVLMPWASSVPSIVAGFLPGQEDGNAIASILFGDVNPGAKLPLTFPMKQDEIPVNTPAQYPGINNEGDYSEKLLVGFKWYDAKNVEPLFEFGRGLSYTTFEYSNLKVAGKKISFDVKNSGSVDGQEVAQLYLGFPAGANEPPKLLRGFEKVEIKAGGTVNIDFTMDVQEHLSVWNVADHTWKPVTGTFDVYVGSSSRDIRLKGTLQN